MTNVERLELVRHFEEFCREANNLGGGNDAQYAHVHHSLYTLWQQTQPVWSATLSIGHDCYILRYWKSGKPLTQWEAAYPLAKRRQAVIRIDHETVAQ